MNVIVNCKKTKVSNKLILNRKGKKNKMAGIFFNLEDEWVRHFLQRHEGRKSEGRVLAESDLNG